MRKILFIGVLALALGAGGCCSLNTKAVNDIATAGIGITAELQTYWDADVAAGKHEKAWADAKKAALKGYLDAVQALQNQMK